MDVPICCAGEGRGGVVSHHSTLPTYSASHRNGSHGIRIALPCLAFTYLTFHIHTDFFRSHIASHFTFFFFFFSFLFLSFFFKLTSSPPRYSQTHYSVPPVFPIVYLQTYTSQHAPSPSPLPKKY
ncbi:hypothetical protein F4775DRAFT_73254 [Biscogniauxia sp. FL1348]|nr:hypothetical protein F4775DRAFT_73254 [Biscogniauxia sp. FL1348]